MNRLDPLEDMSQGRALRPSRVGILGGGTAGLLSALALKEWRPDLDVVLIASSRIPVSGVGEATTPPIVPFLFNYLGIDPHRFEREVEPCMKLGIRFEWGQPAPYHFNYAFGDGDLVDAQAHDGHTRRYAMSSQLMEANKGLFAQVGGRVFSLLKDTRFALHLDNRRLLSFLHARARDVGVLFVDATVTDVETDGGLVKRVLTDDGRTLAYDLWVDCSGFDSLLLGKALGVPFESYAGSLFTDTAVTAVRDNQRRPRPYTTATTMQAGWCWQIPLRGEDHLGYVHSSRFLSAEAAADELGARFPGARDFRTVRFQSGRRRDFFAGNVVAIGNAYGFVEPLESTAIHMIILSISRLIALLQGGGHDAAQVSAHIGAHWDWLRWFLAVHYRFNRQIDSPFWNEVHMTTDWSGMEDTVRDFIAHGALSQRSERRSPGMRDVVFGPNGLDVMLLGQGVLPERLVPATSAAEWSDLMSMREAVVACALPQEGAWQRMAEDPTVLAALVHDPQSWCHKLAADMHRDAPTRGRSQEALAFWTREAGVPAMLGRDAAKLPDEFPTSPNIDFGKFIRRVPEVVLRPKDQNQLSECLQMCVRRRLPIRIRGTGHSSGGQALADEGAVIDTRWLKRIIADAPGEQRIRVETGLWWLELCSHLRAQGRRPIVLTATLRMSIGGTLAVGGFGDSTHREGLQIAKVSELMVMTLDGTRHRVKPGDDLFDWSLAGRGQFGVITEAVIETETRGYDLEARVFRWPTFEQFLRDARLVAHERRFDLIRARVQWTRGLPVGGAGGHISPTATAAADFDGLVAVQGARESVDLFEGTSEPNERWLPASPAVEMVLPVDGAGLGAVHEIARRLMASDIVKYLSDGSAVMLLSGRDAARFPMAPLPASDQVMIIAVRPEMPVAEVPRYLPLLRGLADVALAAGGKIYLMGLTPTTPGWFQKQLGAERYQRFLALKAKWDPDGLLNPGLAGPS